MREILFRGKRKDNGEWIEGFYFQKKNPFSEYGEPIRHFISDLPPFGAEVIHETVGQYTGLKDKNGKRIFEGDIIKSGNRSGSAVSVVKYGNYRPDMLTEAMDVAFGMRFKSDLYGLYAQERDGEQMVLPESTEYIEVIGNIHDNPELLEDA